MSAKDDRDRDVKYTVLEDIFEKIGVINYKKNNGFKLIWGN